MKFGIVVFPGTNCDRDSFYVLKNILRQKVRTLWHKETSIGDLDCIILPGGFSYGDYLRTGAIARFSPIMNEVIRFAKKGGKVLGICNGFQILTEAGLLPGVLMRNETLRFVCETVSLQVQNNQTIFSRRYRSREIVRMPVAHGDGNYFADDETVKRLEGEGRVVFRYDGANPNGSVHGIAGIMNEAGNILGLMPHPERCSEPLLGNEDGRRLFESIIDFL